MICTVSAGVRVQNVFPPQSYFQAISSTFIIMGAARAAGIRVIICSFINYSVIKIIN